MKSKEKPENINGVFIKRESHLGYRAYSIVIQDGKATVNALHNSPDIQAVAQAYANEYLGSTL